MIENSFYLGETVTCTVEIRRRIDNILFDPSSIKITIIQNRSNVNVVPHGSSGGSQGETPVVNSANMNKITDGVYFYDWVSTKVGFYDVQYVATDGGKISIQKDNFIIK